ncbi:hypothetical protein EC991_004568 [Linnemannia zychae]|nr:hypothetical protein EC991_004568 [Linnemannia zychae]
MVYLLSSSKNATILFSCLVISSVLSSTTALVSARSLAQDSVALLSEEEPSSPFLASVDHGKETTFSRPAALQDENNSDEEDELIQLQRQRQQQQQQHLYDIQPVFVIDQTEFDVYLGVYPDKRPRPLNASTKRRKKKKKKKKKPSSGLAQEAVEGQVMKEEELEAPPIQGGQYQGPVYEQKSLKGFRMKLGVIESPWRHRMSYKLEWTVDQDLREEVGEALTRVETTRRRKPKKDGAIVSGYFDYYDGEGEEFGQEDTVPMVEPQSLREGSELMMDFLLIPLDQVKSNELLLTRVPVSSMQAVIQLRPEVLEGWYRLQIHFWEEPDPTSQDCRRFDENTSLDDNGKDWDATESILLSSPGQLKDDTWADNCFPRQVGLWRGAEAIEVTGLGPKDLEWKEFIETLSRETRQEQWSLAEFKSRSSGEQSTLSREQQKAILREEHLAIEEFREPRSVVADGEGVGSRWSKGLGRLSGLHHRIKGFLADPWGVTTTGPALAPIASSSSFSTKPPSIPLSKRQKPSYKRTIFPQDSFRYQKFVGPNIKDVVPDFLVQELEEFEDNAMEALELQQERIQQQRKTKKQDGQKEMADEEEVPAVIYPMSEWDPEIARLQELMGVWNEGAFLRKRDAGSGSGEVYTQDKKEEQSGDGTGDRLEEPEEELILLQGSDRMKRLSPRIWQGAIETDPSTVSTWRSNQDRIISWRIPTSSSSSSDNDSNDEDDDSPLLLAIELVTTPVFQQKQSQDHGLVRLNLPITGGSRMGWTREMMIEKALQQPIVALLTDRIPMSWGAMQVQMPAWVPTGTYHIRVRGIRGEQGGGGGSGVVVVEDVSQPFVVLSDPYLYSYS